ncbi:poly a polymerase cid pap -related [Holotrichia oblita]|uniref:Poly a polymerase cid pap -related n=1 Tax=Holotrichia oblita TaxID=644536 RepID=A0ACB9TMK1_HOLOL|nr:poly a polymerase cid pap -related [Holotrichia oblita]
MSILCIFSHFSNSRFYKLSCDAVKCVKQRIAFVSSIHYRYLSQKLSEANVKQTFSSFDDVIATKKLEANRSILVQVQSAQSCKELYAYCSAFSTVKQMFHYSIGVEPLISDQMLLLYNATKLNDVGTRLRFITARQIEMALSGIFPHMLAYPFGSSVNGFGKMGCDLDLVLRLNENCVPSTDSRLVFHSKAITASERSTSQRHMEAIGDLLQLFLPGCSQVRRILQARVPIIKYYQQLADVECDLSMSNMSGVHMSNLLYIMGEIDTRVRPLVFTIRKWAAEVGLTNSYPGRWITNFSLTLMVLAFLQKPGRNSPLLPGLNILVKSAGPEDTFITEDGINCTFLRNLDKLDFKTKNSDSLQSLLEQFFIHYSQFDFHMKAICLNDGSAVTKPDHSPLYIVNPLERGLNVSKNVSLEELEKLKMEMRNAAWLLESQESKGMNWGILSLFESKKKTSMATSKQPKLLEVSKLFDSEETNIDIEFKNGQAETVNAVNETVKGRLKRGKSRRQ